MGRGGVVYGPHTYGAIGIVGRTNSKVVVGKYCSIGNGVQALMEDDHEMGNISTYPFGHPNMWISSRFGLPDKGVVYKANVKMDIVVGNDVWIGQGAILFRGAKIGDGAVIGAYAKVIKKIPSYAVVVGDSRIVRKRFSEDDIAFLLKLKWWDFDDATVARLVPILHSSNIIALREWAHEQGLPG